MKGEGTPVFGERIEYVILILTMMPSGRWNISSFLCACTWQRIYDIIQIIKNLGLNICHFVPQVAFLSCATAIFLSYEYT